MGVLRIPSLALLLSPSESLRLSPPSLSLRLRPTSPNVSASLSGGAGSRGLSAQSVAKEEPSPSLLSPTPPPPSPIESPPRSTRVWSPLDRWISTRGTLTSSPVPSSRTMAPFAVLWTSALSATPYGRQYSNMYFPQVIIVPIWKTADEKMESWMP
ncbi:unnamed protein product [Musa hybrid cultivar]